MGCAKDTSNLKGFTLKTTNSIISTYSQSVTDDDRYGFFPAIVIESYQVFLRESGGNLQREMDKIAVPIQRN
jgi:hypothetical protein